MLGFTRGRLIALILAAAVAQPARAQVLYGSLTGNVTDSTGAVVVGAKVRALNVGTNVAKEATTDERGAFLFSDLLPGEYDGHHRGRRLRLATCRRRSGSIRTRSAASTRGWRSPGSPRRSRSPPWPRPLQTDRADVHITQTAREVNDLPLSGSLGRNYQSLMQVVPGSTIVRTENGQGEANSQAGSPQRAISFSANGVSGWQNQTRIDGSPRRSTSGCPPTRPTCRRPRRSRRSASSPTPTTPSRAWPAAPPSTWWSSRAPTSFRGTAWGYDTNSALRARNVFQTTPIEPEEHRGAVRRQPGRPHPQGQAVLLRERGAVDPAHRRRQQPCRASLPPASGPTRRVP